MAMSGEIQVSWQDYAAILLRRRWLLIIPCVVGVTIAMAVGLSMPKIYQSKTILLVQDPKIMNPLMRGMAVSSPVSQRMRVIQEELLGWTSLSRLAHELGLDRQAQSPLALESVIKKLQKDIVVQDVSKTSGLITLSYEHPNPEMAQRVLNTVTNIYIQRNIESQTAEAETAIRFIESEMAAYKKTLEDSERELREFKELYTMDMPVATTLNNQIIRLEVQLAQLLVENTQEHPTVVQVTRQIQEFKAKRNEEIKRVITQALLKGASPEIYGDLLKALNAPSNPQADSTVDPKIRQVREAYNTYVERMEGAAMSTQRVSADQIVPPVAPPEEGQTQQSSDLLADGGVLSITLGPRQEQELARLRRDYQINSSAYQEMKRRLELANVTQRLGQSDEGTKFKIIEPARLPLRPVSPNLWLIFTGSLTAGLCIGVCAVFAAEYLDQSFQTVEEVQAALALPVLGSISTIVTPGDVEARRRQMRRWVFLQAPLAVVKTHVFRPVWSHVDQFLLRWGL